MTGKDGLSSSVVETIAGFTAGIATTLSLHPLDLIKTRLQGTCTPIRNRSSKVVKTTNIGFDLVDRTYSSRVGGSLRIIRQIFHDEGGLAAFYRGLTPNIIGNSTSWALYFLLYGDIKDAIGNWRLRRSPQDGSQPQQQHLTSSDYFIASGTAGSFFFYLGNSPLPSLEIAK
jgi:solute carrier family 25 folate transporter 32